MRNDNIVLRVRARAALFLLAGGKGGKRNRKMSRKMGAQRSQRVTNMVVRLVACLYKLGFL